MKKVVLSGYIEVPGDDLATVIAELADHIKLTRQENGCLAFNVTQCPDDPGRFNVYEEFQSTDAFEKHQARTKASAWALATANASRHYTITEE